MPQACHWISQKNVHSIHWDDILRPSSNFLRIAFLYFFHSTHQLIRCVASSRKIAKLLWRTNVLRTFVLVSHIYIYMTDQDTKDIFKLLPFTSCKSERNLCNHLVRASERQPLTFSDAGTFHCKRRYCNAYKFVTNCSAIHVKGPKVSFDVIGTFNGISKNIVYGIICKRCNIIYMEETGRWLADRITEHIRSIRNNFAGFPVAQHFSPPSYCSLNDFSVTGIIHCNCSNVNRLNIENRIIFKLGLLSPLGLSISLT